MATLFKGFSLVKIALFVPFLLVTLFAYFTVKKNRQQTRRAAVNEQVGKKFPALPMIDINGNAAKLDLSTSKETIIDFWFKNCPGCIVEMQQFEEALKGKENQVGIVSVCVDDTASFKKVMRGQVPVLDFVKTLPNWQHLLLNYPAQGINNKQEIARQLGVTSYPSYFVLNKNGLIADAPPSAVNYIKTSLNKQNAFWVFLTSRRTWRSTQTWVLLLLSLFIYQLVANLIVKRAGDRD